MAKEFVRNIRNTKCIGKNKEPLETNEQNDLLNEKPDVYVRNENYYHCLTNAIQRIDSLSKYIDVLKKENSNPVKEKVTVELSTGELEKELNQIQRDLSNLYNVEIVSLKEAIKELNDTIQNLPLQDLEEFKKKISELEDKINNGLSDLEKKIEKINSRLDSLKITRSSTIVIANYDSHENSIKGADIVIEEGENASKKINDAIQSLKGTGGEVKLMEGIYNMEYGIAMNIPNVHLTGIPNATILKKGSVWGNNPINSSSYMVSTTKLPEDVKVFISNITTDGHGFYCTGKPQVTNCTSNNSVGHGFSCRGNSQITNCTSNNSHEHGFYCSGNPQVTNCTSNNSSSNGFDCGSNSQITNCTSNNSSSNGFDCGGNSQITNCTSSNSGEDGFYCSYTFKGIVANNILKNDTLDDNSSSPAIVQYNIIQEEV